MASNSLFSSTGPLICWGELSSVCVCVSYIMLCNSGIKLVLEDGRSLELGAVEPAMGLLINTST